jgi:hypothetical protein
MSSIAHDGAAFVRPDADSKASGSGLHRADYILERGVWHVSCRTCGWQAHDRARRQLASLFRFHLRSAAALPPAPESSP